MEWITPVAIVALTAVIQTSSDRDSGVRDRCAGTISQESARAFASAWIDAWNSHDLSRILSHYTDDFEMLSPLIVERTGEPSGLLRGKANVALYWQLGLDALPPLKFELLDVFAGVGSVTIYYRSVGRRMAAEILELDGTCRVTRGRAHYGGPA